MNPLPICGPHTKLWKPQKYTEISQLISSTSKIVKILLGYVSRNEIAVLKQIDTFQNL